MIFEVLAVLSLVIFLIYQVSKRKYDYWKKRKIPYLEPSPIFGNYASYIIQKTFIGQAAQQLCQKLPNVPYFGVFFGSGPTLIVQDPEVLKLVMTKDYYYFNSREIANYTHKEVITQNLFFTHGDRWKVLRQNLTPLFSSGKMKNMFYLIDRCAHVFETMLDKEFKTNKVQCVRPLMARFTMDCIGNCAFGIDTGTMSQPSDKNPFTMMGSLIFADEFIRGLKLAARSVWPAIFYGLGMKTFPLEINEFFNKLMKGVFAERKYKPTDRHDFVDLILNWTKENYITGDKMQNKEADDKTVKLKVDDEMLVGQCMMFFAAGFETSATTLHFTLYELAKNQKAQEQVIEEIDKYLLRHNNKLEYECITELPFADACLDEALRLYPVLGVLTREVVEDYTLPCGAVIEKGVRVHIPLYHIQHNPDFFPEPEVFKPERFYGENKHNIRPYTYMPFGDGPRLCIGMRFAKMQMLAGIVTILKKYRVEVTEETQDKIEFTATTLTTQTRDLVKLKFVEREGWQQRQYTA